MFFPLWGDLLDRKDVPVAYQLPPEYPPSEPEPVYARRVFGLFLVIAVAGFGWSLTHQAETLPALTGAAQASALSQAYAACQDSVRTNALDPTRLRFPAEPESTQADDGETLSLASSVTATPKLGEPYTQHFTCRAVRSGHGASEIWRVSRVAMDLPAS